MFYDFMQDHDVKTRGYIDFSELTVADWTIFQWIMELAGDWGARS